MYCVLCTVYCVLCTVYCVLCHLGRSVWEESWTEEAGAEVRTTHCRGGPGPRHFSSLGHNKARYEGSCLHNLYYLANIKQQMQLI